MYWWLYFLAAARYFSSPKRVCQCLVHASVFPPEDLLHLVGGEMAYEVDAPVGEVAEHLLGELAVGIDVGIAQAGEDLMLAVEGYPSSVFLELCEVALVEACPYLVDGLSAYEAFESLCVEGVGILAVLHYAEAVVESSLEL